MKKLLLILLLLPVIGIASACSESQKKERLAPGLPIISYDVASQTLSVEQVEGAEYRINGGAWSSNSTFTVARFNEYLVELRYTETREFLPSPLRSVYYYTAGLKGAGSTSNPYLIESIDDFNAMHSIRRSVFLLANSLDFEDVSYTPIGTQAKPFISELYGGGNTIKNLTVSGEYAGLFGYAANGAVLSGIKLESIVCEGSALYAGALLGRGTDVAISDILVSESALLLDSGVTAGGAVGMLGGVCVFNNVVVDKTGIMISGEGRESTVGGAIGKALGSRGTQIAAYNDITTYVDIVINAPTEVTLGGAIGYADYLVINGADITTFVGIEAEGATVGGAFGSLFDCGLYNASISLYGSRDGIVADTSIMFGGAVGYCINAVMEKIEVVVHNVNYASVLLAVLNNGDSGVDDAIFAGGLAGRGDLKAAYIYINRLSLNVDSRHSGKVYAGGVSGFSSSIELHYGDITLDVQTLNNTGHTYAGGVSGICTDATVSKLVLLGGLSVSAIYPLSQDAFCGGLFGTAEYSAYQGGEYVDIFGTIEADTVMAAFSLTVTGAGGSTGGIVGRLGGAAMALENVYHDLTLIDYSSIGDKLSPDYGASTSFLQSPPPAFDVDPFTHAVGNYPRLKRLA